MSAFQPRNCFNASLVKDLAMDYTSFRFDPSVSHRLNQLQISVLSRDLENIRVEVFVVVLYLLYIYQSISSVYLYFGVRSNFVVVSSPQLDNHLPLYFDVPIA